MSQRQSRCAHDSRKLRHTCDECSRRDAEDAVVAVATLGVTFALMWLVIKVYVWWVAQ